MSTPRPLHPKLPLEFASVTFILDHGARRQVSPSSATPSANLDDSCPPQSSGSTHATSRDASPISHLKSIPAQNSHAVLALGNALGDFPQGSCRSPSPPGSASTTPPGSSSVYSPENSPDCTSDSSEEVVSPFGRSYSPEPFIEARNSHRRRSEESRWANMEDRTCSKPSDDVSTSQHRFSDYFHCTLPGNPKFPVNASCQGRAARSSQFAPRTYPHVADRRST